MISSCMLFMSSSILWISLSLLTILYKSCRVLLASSIRLSKLLILSECISIAFSHCLVEELVCALLSSDFCVFDSSRRLDIFLTQKQKYLSYAENASENNNNTSWWNRHIIEI